MNIEIHYCQVWNYLPKASRLEDELKGGFPKADITLVASSGGDFRVVLDGNTIYDKLADTQTFPDYGEITNKINSLL